MREELMIFLARILPFTQSSFSVMVGMLRAQGFTLPARLVVRRAPLHAFGIKTLRLYTDYYPPLLLVHGVAAIIFVPPVTLTKKITEYIFRIFLNTSHYPSCLYIPVGIISIVNEA